MAWLWNSNGGYRDRAEVKIKNRVPVWVRFRRRCPFLYGVVVVLAFEFWGAALLFVVWSMFFKRG